MIESSQLHSLAQQFGTPLYVYDGDVIERQWKAIEDVLRGLNHLTCYAVKANSTLGILSLIHSWGSGFDIVSVGELRRVEAVGGDTSRVVFAGVGKSEEEIEYALPRAIRFFNVESADELAMIEAVAQRQGVVAKVSFRINPDVSVETHPYLATGIRSSKFGISTHDGSELWEHIRKSKNLALVGVDCHIGSQIASIDALERAYSEVLNFAKHLEAHGAPIRHVDFGGGFAVDYSGQYSPIRLDQLSVMIRRLVAGIPYEIVVEPGKFLVAESGKLLSRVVVTKSTGARDFVIVDAGMNDLIRPALYQAHHAIELVPAVGEPERRGGQLVDVAGPVCESGCVFAKDERLPPLQRGDLVAFRDAGAYGMSMASNYNTRRRPAEVLVYRGKTQLIRERESYESLWSGERIFEL